MSEAEEVLRQAKWALDRDRRARAVRDFYTCGTCGSRTLIIGSTYDAAHELYVWVLRCGNNHLLVPVQSNVYTINFGEEQE